MIRNYRCKHKQQIQEMEDRISGTEDMIEEIDSLVKENINSNKFLTQNIKEVWDIMKKPNLKIIGRRRSSA